MNGRQDYKKYISVLEQFLLPVSDWHYESTFIFEHGNAPIHTSLETVQWLSTNTINLMQTPPRSTNLTRIDNLWGLFALSVYCNANPFNTVDDLKKTVIEEWEKISSESMKKLIGSVQNRGVDILCNEGGRVNY